MSVPTTGAQHVGVWWCFRDLRAVGAAPGGAAAAALLSLAALVRPTVFFLQSHSPKKDPKVQTFLKSPDSRVQTPDSRVKTSAGHATKSTDEGRPVDESSLNFSQVPK